MLELIALIIFTIGSIQVIILTFTSNPDYQKSIVILLFGIGIKVFL